MSIGAVAAIAVDARGLAEMLGVSLRHIRRLDSAGRLPRGIRLGHAVRWPVAEIHAWLGAGAPDRDSWETTKEGGSVAQRG